VTPTERQQWERLGLVWVASGEQPWARTHAALPTATMLDEERIRVYVACLDAAKVGRIGWVDVAARDPRQVLAVSEHPVLDVGAPGTFDDNGVNPLWLVEHAGRLYLYYVGWQLGTRVRYYLFCGLAASDDGGNSFLRVSQAPLLDRTDGELFVRTAPCVRREDGVWKMWYIGGDSWVEGRGKQLPRYGLRYLESDDPRRWRGPSRPVMDVRGGDEHGFGRPFVLREDGRYRMWYSVRTISAGYRLGYAESPDGLTWERMDDAAGIEPSPEGWDSQMVCYSFLQATRYGTYLFYNGNDYGATGFGAAVLR
jgi:hypothetical protein